MSARAALIDPKLKRLIAWSTIVAMVLAFGLMAHGALDGHTAAFDHRILLIFRDPADPGHLVGPGWLAEALRDLTSLGSTTVLGFVVLAAAGYLALSSQPKAAILALASALGGQGVISLLKLWFDRPRPSIIPGAPEVFTASFPSGHAMLSAVIYLTLGTILAQVKPNPALRFYVLSIAFVLTASIGMSRVALGVHWPTDVIAGWCVGVAWAMLCALTAHRMQRSGTMDRLA